MLLDPIMTENPVLFWLGLTIVGAGFLGLCCWLQYTIIWRAVARGIRAHEYEADHVATFTAATVPDRPRHAPPGTGAPLRDGQGPRDW